MTRTEPSPRHQTQTAMDPGRRRASARASLFQAGAHLRFAAALGLVLVLWASILWASQ